MAQWEIKDSSIPSIVNLDEIFNMQKDLMGYIKEKTPNESFWGDEKGPFEGYTKFMLAHALLKEVCEYTDELKWKWHKKPANYKVDEKNRREVELPDIFHYFVQLCIVDNVSPSMLYETYKKKWEENFGRQDSGY